ncbi:MAG TPA: LysR family transcriptional regulator [Rhabdaerophilum sp.]|nr:LysR family transcriptional regulator [Rhabdaerophilum sp.]
MQSLTLRQIEALQAVGSAGSLVAAAAQLNMTPAALTARIKALEDTVGLPLFDRTPAGLRPNMAGDIALEAARKIENAVREFREKMDVVRTGKGGRLSVGVVSTAKYFAPRLISAFTQEFPGVDFRLTIGNRDATMEALRRFEVDVALTGRPPNDIPTQRLPIGAHPYVLVAPPSHRLAGTNTLSKDLFAGETFLFREEGSGSRSLFDYFIGDIAIQRAQIGIELGSNETIKQAVMAGLGIALISAHTIAAEIADGRLVTLNVTGLPIIRHWYVVHRTDRDLSPTALAFRDFAQERCAHFLPRLHPPRTEIA